VKIQRALLSVSDKSGIVEFARGLSEAGIEIISSGGTAAELAAAGVPVVKVSDVTGAPEILGGRVKTLHPKVHGGILADRRNPDHVDEIAHHAIDAIDLVVCNLYPFEETTADPNVSEDAAVEQIDIGGPAMVRAAAKNFANVTVIVDPNEYATVLEEIRAAREIPLDMRRRLARDAFAHTAAYDTVISTWLAHDEVFPEEKLLRMHKVMDLRYGENPHQAAAFYRGAGPPTGLAAAEQLHGKELSYNNLLDTDAAWRLVLELDRPAAAIIKHSNPCGVARAASLSEAYVHALECDRTSAFGGIVALNESCDEDTARAVAEIFTEVVIAPRFEAAALETLKQKKNLRILLGSSEPVREIDVRGVSGGFLVQARDGVDDLDDARVVTKADPDEGQWEDLRFAWTVAKHVKSNAIVLARDQVAVGVGAGQMSRVEATELAARRAGARAKETACASDAFFPFRDGLDAAVSAGAVAVIQPGGSVRDEEVIAAADEHGIPMVFTGRRHFRH